MATQTVHKNWVCFRVLRVEVPPLAVLQKKKTISFTCANIAEMELHLWSAIDELQYTRTRFVLVLVSVQEETFIAHPTISFLIWGP